MTTPLRVMIVEDSVADTELQVKEIDIPLIMLSGTIGEDIAVTAMKAGAHDYIMKNNTARLVPAIKRELREAEVRREFRRTQERVQYLAYYDPLTDLPNRDLFTDRLEQAVLLGQREKHFFTLMLMDLDRFKIVNDTLGHHAGDQALQQVAARLKTCLRESDTVARMGGDEFSVLLPTTTHEDGAVVVAQKNPGNHRKIVPDRGSGIQDRHQHGNRPVSRTWRRSRCAAARRGHGDVRGQTPA